LRRFFIPLLHDPVAMKEREMGMLRLAEEERKVRLRMSEGYYSDTDSSVASQSVAPIVEEVVPPKPKPKPKSKVPAKKQSKVAASRQIVKGISRKR
jgi:hypothetical protein